MAFAKSASGIELAGNARDWWGRAAGLYARGRAPEIGSVLAFRPTARMPLGHVAVVSAVADRRTILIDQSHWGQPGIARDMRVVDVSEDNDWSAVRVELAGGRGFGSIYPVHGFIYPRPDDAGDGQRTQIAAGRMRRADRVEVAEAPQAARPGILDLRVGDAGTAYVIGTGK